MATYTAEIYRRPLFDPADDLFRRCLTVSGIAAAVMLIGALLVPIREHVISRVDELPPRFAKLILEPKRAPVMKPLPAGDHVAKPSGGGGGGGGGGGEGGLTAKVTLPKPVVHPGVTGGRAATSAPLASNSGQAGRARASAEVGSRLASSTASLSSALAGLSTSLGAAPVAGPARTGGGRARVVRSARGDHDLSGVSAGLGGGASADLGSSAVEGSLVAIGDLSALRPGTSSGSGGGSGGGAGGGLGSGYGTGVGPGSGSGTGGGSGSGNGTGTGSGSGEGWGGGSGGGAYQGGSAPGVYRSNASLLAVIQRYAAGIQYCYGNELKRDSSLRGKLVVALTVSASGDVLEAAIVQNTVGSSRLAQCALSQIRDWKFPPIREGVTTFQAPFVFTPPN